MRYRIAERLGKFLWEVDSITHVEMIGWAAHWVLDAQESKEREERERLKKRGVK